MNIMTNYKKVIIQHLSVKHPDSLNPGPLQIGYLFAKIGTNDALTGEWQGETCAPDDYCQTIRDRSNNKMNVEKLEPPYMSI